MLSNGDSNLQNFGLPILKNIQDFSDNLHLSKGLIYNLSKYNHHYYREFKLPKRQGGYRYIYSPSKEMKAVQAWILRNILDNINISECATGFVKGKSVLDNAKKHEGNRYFLCLDIEEFFPSIKYSHIYTVFHTFGYNKHVSHILSSLCSTKGILPQGAVTSPALSNIVCTKIDKRISGYAGKHNIVYSRYADDMAFSALTHKWLTNVYRIVREIVVDEGFSLNEKKTRFLGPLKQRKVTGIVISDDSMGIGRKKKREIRAAIHKLINEYTQEGNGGYSDVEREKLKLHIKGWLAYIHHIDSVGHRQLVSYTSNLSGRYGVINPLA